MSRKRKRGSRGGKRVQRGLANVEAREDELAEEEFNRLSAEAYDLYAELMLEFSGLRPLPRDRHRWGHFTVPLPNDWFLEMTSGGSDGALMPPGEEGGDGCIYWLITPNGLYAAEEDIYFDGAPDEIPEAAVLHACRLLWHRFEEIMGTAAARDLRKGLPRPHALKIKALVARGDFAQPKFDED